MKTSGFINEGDGDEKIEILGISNATSNIFKRRINGELYFMKQLRPEYANDPRYRSLFFKEYECGKAISHPYVVRYTDIGEDEEGLYIIMEYVNGISLKEMLLHEPTYFDKTADYPVDAEDNKFLLTAQNCSATLDEDGKIVLVTEDALSDLKGYAPRKVLNQWTFQSRMYNAARYVCTQPDMQLVQLVSFGCGIDAITDAYSITRVPIK